MLDYRELQLPIPIGALVDLDLTTIDVEAARTSPSSQAADKAFSVSETVPPDPVSIIAPTARLSNWKIVLLAVAMATTYFLGTASSTATTIMIPKMAADLGLSELSTQWIVSSYTLAYGCALLFAGRIADLYSRKTLFVSGLSIFCVFSITSASMRSRIPLCVIRAMSGVGLAIASPAVYGIAGSTVRHEPARTLLLGALGSGGPVGACVGTLIGGAITEISNISWSYLFYIVAAISLIPLSIGMIIIPRDQRKVRHGGLRDIDWLGGFLVTASMSTFLFSLVQSSIVQKGWSTPYVPALLVTAIVLAILFVLWERHLERNCKLQPVIKPSLFIRHHGKVTAVLFCAHCACASVYGWTYTTTILYQTVKQKSALDNALHVLPANLVGLLAAACVLVLASRVRAPYLLYAGAGLTGIANLLLAVEPESTSYWASEFVSGLTLPWAIDFTVAIGSILISNLVEEDEQSIGGAAFQTFCQIGGSLGVCLSSLISTQQEEVSGSLMTGLRAADWFNSALSLLIAVLTFIALRRVGLARNVRTSSTC